MENFILVSGGLVLLVLSILAYIHKRKDSYIKVFCLLSNWENRTTTPRIRLFKPWSVKESKRSINGTVNFKVIGSNIYAYNVHKDYYGAGAYEAICFDVVISKIIQYEDVECINPERKKFYRFLSDTLGDDAICELKGLAKKAKETKGASLGYIFYSLEKYTWQRNLKM